MKTPSSEKKALHLATHSGWYRFEREGEKWLPVERALTYWSATCLAVAPQEPRLVYVGTEHSGVFFSHDGGLHWERPDPNVPRLMVASLLGLPGALLVGTVPAALYRTSNGGWTEMEGLRHGSAGSAFPPNPDLGSRTRYLAADPKRAARVYAGIEVGGMLVSDDGGLTWRACNEGLADPDVHEVVACARTPGLVVAACGEGVFRSLDRGGRWEKITPSGERTYGTAVAEDNGGVIYLGIARGRPNTWIHTGSADSAIFRSKDGGAHWEAVVEGLRGGVMDLCAAPDGEGVFAGTSDGSLLSIDSSGHRVLAGALPCINALAVAA
jgi:photosystem II stability/assembly factor-like uncharacterized protein